MLRYIIKPQQGNILFLIHCPHRLSDIHLHCTASALKLVLRPPALISAISRIRNSKISLLLCSLAWGVGCSVRVLWQCMLFITYRGSTAV